MVESSLGYQGVIVKEMIVYISIFSVVIELNTKLIGAYKQLALSIWIRINTRYVLISKTVY